MHPLSHQDGGVLWTVVAVMPPPDRDVVAQIEGSRTKTKRPRRDGPQFDTEGNRRMIHRLGQISSSTQILPEHGLEMWTVYDDPRIEWISSKSSDHESVQG